MALMHSESNRILPESMRCELREPLGELIEDSSFFPESFGGRVITVGDVITRRFVDSGKMPWIAIIDGKSRRKMYSFDACLDGGCTKVKNPAGELTTELWGALRAACMRDEMSTICVEGEEDLAALPAILLAPEDTVVVYGMPDVGVVVVKSGKAREKVREIIGRMEVKSGNRDI